MQTRDLLRALLIGLSCLTEDFLVDWDPQHSPRSVKPVRFISLQLLLTILLFRQRKQVVFWTLGTLFSVKNAVFAAQDYCYIKRTLQLQKTCSKFPGSIHWLVTWSYYFASLCICKISNCSCSCTLSLVYKYSLLLFSVPVWKKEQKTEHWQKVDKEIISEQELNW
jgi:hypothetical protein